MCRATATRNNPVTTSRPRAEKALAAVERPVCRSSWCGVSYMHPMGIIWLHLRVLNEKGKQVQHKY